MATYTVKSGDTLSKIGQQLGVDWHQITGYRSGNPNLIYPGEVLTVSGGNQPSSTPSAPTPQTQPASSGTAGGDAISQLLSRMETPDTSAYQSAVQAEQAQIPLIQQRYKDLLAELNQQTTEGVSAEQKAETSTLGEAKARAGAMGVYPGTTELGTEDAIRKQAADTIANLQKEAQLKGETYATSELADESQVNTAIANLGVTQAQAEQSGLKDLLSSVIALQNQQSEESLRQAQTAYYDYRAGGGTTGGSGTIKRTQESVDPNTGAVYTYDLDSSGNIVGRSLKSLPSVTVVPGPSKGGLFGTGFGAQATSLYYVGNKQFSSYQEAQNYINQTFGSGGGQSGNQPPSYFTPDQPQSSSGQYSYYG